MDNYKIPTSVIIDLSKAFDTLNNDILISKLKHYGIFGVELRCFSSYLSDRVQYVEFLDSVSETQHIRMGVPQGFVLGPLLFLREYSSRKLPNFIKIVNFYILLEYTCTYCLISLCKR